MRSLHTLQLSQNTACAALDFRPVIAPALIVCRNRQSQALIALQLSNAARRSLTQNRLVIYSLAFPTCTPALNRLWHRGHCCSCNTGFKPDREVQSFRLRNSFAAENSCTGKHVFSCSMHNGNDTLCDSMRTAFCLPVADDLGRPALLWSAAVAQASVEQISNT